jgi:hypothetical protein
MLMDMGNRKESIQTGQQNEQRTIEVDNQSTFSAPLRVRQTEKETLNTYFSVLSIHCFREYHHSLNMHYCTQQ